MSAPPPLIAHRDVAEVSAGEHLADEVGVGEVGHDVIGAEVGERCSGCDAVRGGSVSSATMSTQAVEAIKIIHGHMRTVFSSLAADDWAKPSACAGWRVQDVLAHVTSNQKEFVDPTPAPAEPSAGPAPAMKAEEAMEMLVAPRKDWTPQELIAEYDRFTEAWFAVMGAMQEEPLASTPLTLSDLGTYPTHLLAEAFAFDHYCHLRIDLLAPTGPLTVSLPPATDAELRPGIDWMFLGIPQMQPDDLPAVVTRPLGFVLTGSGGGEWTLRPGTDGTPMTVVEGVDADAAATVTSSAHDFVRWGTKRCDWRECATLSGDEAYGASVLDALNII